MTNKMIILRSNDGEEFEIEEEVAKLSKTIGEMIEAEVTEGGIPLPNVEKKALAKVLEYCKRHAKSSSSSDSKGKDHEKEETEELKDWDKEFIDEIFVPGEEDFAFLFDVILAANFMCIQSLIDLTCKATADIIKDRSPEEVRLIFGVENDYTPEEEEAVRNQTKWAFE